MMDRFIDLNVKIQAAYPGRERRELTLENFGTVAFMDRFMRDQIFFGRAIVLENGQVMRSPEGTGLELALWWAFVPEVYRDQVKRGLDAVFPHWEGRRGDEATVQGFIAELREWLMYNLEPQP